MPVPFSMPRVSHVRLRQPGRLVGIVRKKLMYLQYPLAVQLNRSNRPSGSRALLRDCKGEIAQPEAYGHMCSQGHVPPGSRSAEGPPGLSAECGFPEEEVSGVVSALSVTWSRIKDFSNTWFPEVVATAVLEHARTL